MLSNVFLITSMGASGIIPNKVMGPVAQLGARINRTDEVAGSNPARSIYYLVQQRVDWLFIPVIILACRRLGP